MDLNPNLLFGFQRSLEEHQSVLSLLGSNHLKLPLGTRKNKNEKDKILLFIISIAMLLGYAENNLGHG
jgi:hypothetical protein